MIYTPLVQKAMKLAYDAHHGQRDQSGVPYIFHPFYVAELVCQVMPEEVPVCTALLHDVLEDTSLTPQDLEKEFPREVTEAVLLLTHKPGEDYYKYVKRLKEHPVARQVKIMDLYHNRNMDRLLGCDHITAAQKKWREKKYDRALSILRETDG